MLWLLINTGFAQDGCPEKVSVNEFDSYLAALTVSFADRDVELLARNWSQIEKSIPCVSEILPKETALKFHLLTGLYYAVAEEDFKSLQSLSVAKSIDEKVTIPTYIFPDGHYIHENLASVSVAERQEQSIELLDNQRLIFDGIDSTRPKDAPTILQLIEKDEVQYTRYMGPFSNIEIPKNTLNVSEPRSENMENSSGVGRSGELKLNSKKRERLQSRGRGLQIGLGLLTTISGTAAAVTTSSFIESPTDVKYYANQAMFGSFILSGSYLLYDLTKRRLTQEEK